MSKFIDNVLIYIKVIGIFAGAFIGEFLGGVDKLLIALITMICVDYFTGVIVAIYRKKLSSKVGFKGICKKICIFIIVGVATIVEKNLLGDGCVLCTATIFFYIANDGISILENVALLDVPFPEKLKDILIQVKNKADAPLPEKEDTTTQDK